MADSKLSVWLELKDKMSAQFKKTFGNMKKANKSFTESFRKHWLKIATAVAATVFILQKMTKALIETSSKVEQLKVRLVQLLGSVKEGNKVFKDMRELAARVPKTYDEIMESATALAGVVRDGSEEIKQLMPIIVDLSAGSGIAVREVTSQIIKMYSSGAGAADMFRDRGISAALGFQAGVASSAEATMKVIVDQWEDGTGKFAGAAGALAKTWVGATSMMQDAWFNFKVDVGEELFETVKIDLAAILLLIEESKKEGGKYKDVVKGVSDFFVELRLKAVEAVEAILIGGANMVDGFNNLRAAVVAVQLAVSSLHLALLQIRQFQAGTSVWEQLLGQDSIEKREEEIENVRAFNTELAAIMLEANEVAAADNSDAMQLKVDQFKAALAKMRAAAAKHAAELAALEAKNAKETSKRDKKDATRKTEQQKKIEAAYLQSYNNMSSALITYFQIAQGESKKYAGVIKGIKIAEIIINTAAAVMKAWSEPTLPYPTNMIMAASIAAMGVAQVALVASQGFAQGTDSVPSMLTPGEMVVPRDFASAIRAGDLTLGGGGGEGIVININNPNFNDESQSDNVFDTFSDILEENRRARI